jgi:hypothetical protein
MWRCDTCNTTISRSNRARHLETRKHADNIDRIQREEQERRKRILLNPSAMIIDPNLHTPLVPTTTTSTPIVIQNNDPERLRIKTEIEKQAKRELEIKLLLDNVSNNQLDELKKQKFEDKDHTNNSHGVVLVNRVEILSPFAFIIAFKEQMKEQCANAYERL